MFEDSKMYFAISTEAEKTKLRIFFTTFRPNGLNKLTIVVHKFLVAVKFVQKNIRAFVACKYAKIVALLELWNHLEYKYISKKLEEKQQMKLKNMADRAKDKKSLNFDLFDDQTKIEMRKQAKAWNSIDTLMDQKIKLLKAKRAIV